MPNHVLQIDCSGGITGLEAELDIAPYSGPYSTVWIEADVAFNSTYVTAFLAQGSSDEPVVLSNDTGPQFEEILLDPSGTGGWTTLGRSGGTFGGAPASGFAHALTPLQFYHLKLRVTAGSPATADAWIDGVSLGPLTMTGINIAQIIFLDIQAGIIATAGALAWFDNVTAGTTEGGSDILSDDFEGIGAPSASIWNSLVDATVVTDPGIAPPVIGTPNVGRVLIAFDDGPHEPSPTFTAIDQAGDFPDQFVSGYDTRSGKQTLLSQTETGEATVYINDHSLALFDPRNSSSPYFGKLYGRQILLQLYNPVTAVWESQFQGWIDYVTWDIDGSAVNAAGEPINASIQLECVDLFDELDGFGLTPGLAGDVPPSGMEDGVYYAEAHVDDRQIQILTDVGIDSTRYGSPSLASGNVNCQEVKYDPDESALSALRDAADAEFPFISNIYIDRFGKYQFRGRYGRFAPDSVAAEPGSTWDFTRWAVGDGAAIVADATRAQMRILSFQRGRNEVLNVGMCWSKGTTAAQMPSQVYADTTSITDYGQHAAPPMSDLLIADDGLESGNPNARVECYDFAKLLVKNQKDPLESISALQVKTVHPSDARAAPTWAFLTQSDISHIVNVAVGYPGGTGFTGTSPADDYYIEGRSLRVRALEPGFDYVELDCEVSPAVWSMDTHGVFPPFS
jgi:hypothetical protein